MCVIAQCGLYDKLNAAQSGVGWPFILFFFFGEKKLAQQETDCGTECWRWVWGRQGGFPFSFHRANSLLYKVERMEYWIVYRWWIILGCLHQIHNMSHHLPLTSRWSCFPCRASTPHRSGSHCMAMSVSFSRMSRLSSLLQHKHSSTRTARLACWWGADHHEWIFFSWSHTSLCMICFAITARLQSSV